MRLLVTGGAGFIGSSLVDRLLAEGHRVDVVDDLSTGNLANLADARRSPDKRLTVHQLDIRSEALVDLLGRARPDVVYHLASAPPARAVADPVAGADIDVLGSLRVLEAARLCGAAKVVYASSGGVYGTVAADELPVRESHPQRPLSAPAVAKKAVGEYLALYREVHSLEFTALALGHVYGPRQPAGGGVVARFASALVAGEPCVVTGDGRQTRDFVFIDDVVDAFARAAERGGGLVLNVGTGRETAIADLYRTVAERAGAAGLAPAAAVPPAAGPAVDSEVRRIGLDPGRAGIHLGWKPWTSLEEGIDTVLEALRESNAAGT